MPSQTNKEKLCARHCAAIGDCSCVISFDCCPPARHTSSSTICLPFLVQDRGLPLVSHVSKIALHRDAGVRLSNFVLRHESKKARYS